MRESASVLQDMGPFFAQTPALSPVFAVRSGGSGRNTNPEPAIPPKILILMRKTNSDASVLRTDSVRWDQIRLSVLKSQKFLNDEWT